MFGALFGTLFGVAIGCLSALPGLHISVLLVGLLPLVGLGGDFGAFALVGALGSGMTASILAKTFHPATAQTIKSATPEQVLAYRGEGLRAVLVQAVATWCGVITVFLTAIPLLLLKAVNERELAAGIRVLAFLGIPLLLAFVWLTWRRASNKLVTVVVMLAATVIGFYGLHHPALAGNMSVLAPLLGGVFSVPALAMVLFHSGHVQAFPRQQTRVSWNNLGDAGQFYGALCGLGTALVAGLGSGAAVASFAGTVDEEKYLGMHTASEAANHVFAIVLVILIGASHSGVGVALRMQAPVVDGLTGVMLLMTVFFGVCAGAWLCYKHAGQYAELVSRVPQRTVALAVLVITLTLIGWETGLAGLLVAACAGTLGLAARLYCVPNQALTMVLSGPVLIGAVGLAGPLAGLLGILH